jgi:hypothetical protein
MSARSYYEKSGLFLLPHNLLDEYLGKFSSMAKPLRLFDKTTWISYSMSSRFGKAGEFPIPLSEIFLHSKNLPEKMLSRLRGKRVGPPPAAALISRIINQTDSGP